MHKRDYELHGLGTCPLWLDIPIYNIPQKPGAGMPDIPPGVCLAVVLIVNLYVGRVVSVLVGCSYAPTGYNRCSNYVDLEGITMNQVAISNELYEQLKSFIVDPFDDTLEIVIARLINITNKARSRWPDLSPANGTNSHTVAPDADAIQTSPQLSDASKLRSKFIGDSGV
jgi:hypothetical protein